MCASLFEKQSSIKKLHFVGIGGISMSSLAQLARHAGYAVSGSDRSDSPLVEVCRRAGCAVAIGHRAENIGDADLVIYTAAVPADSPELTEAARRGIPTLSRAEFLGELMLGYQNRIGISGTHGKTTTTSMLTHILIEAGFDPTVANGAITRELGGALRIGGRDNFVYEACEYTASFLHFHPTIALITNIELDHTDFYSSLEEVIAAFAGSLKGAETAIINWDDENARKAAEGFEGRLVTFSLKDPSADLYAGGLTFSGGKGCCRPVWQGKELPELTLPVIGAFNMANAMAALAAALVLGVPYGAARTALQSFVGAHRRFEVLYRGKDVTVVDDYAHHPSELTATLTAARALSPGRLITVFQPHTYSRTHDLFADFVRALSLADRVYVADIYAARETDTKGVSAALLAEAIGEKAAYVGGFDAIADALTEEMRPGDLILTMGAGNVDQVGKAFVGRLTGEKAEEQGSEGGKKR